MKTRKLFNRSRTIYLKNKSDWSWDIVLKKVGDLLVRGSIVSDEWYKDVIKQVKKYGFYFVITDDLAFPHISPNENTLKLGTAFIVLKNRIFFGEKKVKYILALSSTNRDEHFQLLLKMIQFWNDENFIKLLNNINNKKDLHNIFEYEEKQKKY